MERLKVGNPAPDFTLPNQDYKEVHLQDLRGKWVILFFYPKDNTPGCILEAIDFSRAKPDLDTRNTVLLGVSADTPETHEKFVRFKELTMTLLSDVNHDVLIQYGVWQLKKNFGKEYMGIVRCTFIIDPDGLIAATWYKVNAAGHAESVIKKLKELQG